MAAIEAKAVTSADALVPEFLRWFHPQVSGGVAKLRRTITGERFFIVWKTHWTWTARPEMYAYPRLLRGTPTTRAAMLSDDQLTVEVLESHKQLVSGPRSERGHGHLRTHRGRRGTSRRRLGHHHGAPGNRGLTLPNLLAAGHQIDQNCRFS
ncbi:hypothetical protein DN585_00740 [Intrasporangium calvum]|nr:hypothetical protein DN585_00740 [Intrasporangium calvum]